MRVKLRKNIDWVETNDFLHGLSHVIDEDDRAALYSYVDQTRWHEGSRPHNLVSKIFDFLDCEIIPPSEQEETK